MSGADDPRRVFEAIRLGTMMGSLATELMRAQLSVDRLAVRMAEGLSRSEIDFEGEKVSLLGLGLSPTFYQYVETTLDMKLSFSFSSDTSDESTRRTTDSRAKAGAEGVSLGLGPIALGSTTTTVKTQVESVDARLASRFQYKPHASSGLSTRLVPVPAPPALLSIVHRLTRET